MLSLNEYLISLLLDSTRFLLAHQNKLCKQKRPFCAHLKIEKQTKSDKMGKEVQTSYGNRRNVRGEEPFGSKVGLSGILF